VTGDLRSLTVSGISTRRLDEREAGMGGALMHRTSDAGRALPTALADDRTACVKALVSQGCAT
jgi:hypothetical protein